MISFRVRTGQALFPVYHRMFPRVLGKACLDALMARIRAGQTKIVSGVPAAERTQSHQRRLETWKPNFAKPHLTPLRSQIILEPQMDPCPGGSAPKWRR